MSLDKTQERVAYYRDIVERIGARVAAYGDDGLTEEVLELLEPGLVLDEMRDLDVVERFDGTRLAPGKAAAWMIDSPVLSKQTLRRAGYRITAAVRKVVLIEVQFNCRAKGEGEGYRRRRIPNAAERTLRSMAKEHVASCRFCRSEE